MTNAGITKGKNPNADIYDSMEALMRFSSGVIGSIGITNVLDWSMNDVIMFKACGDYAVLEYWMDKVRLKVGESDWEEMAVFETTDGDALNTNFLEAIDRENPGHVFGSYSDAVVTLEITLRMNEAAEL